MSTTGAMACPFLFAIDMLIIEALDLRSLDWTDSNHIGSSHRFSNLVMW